MAGYQTLFLDPVTGDLAYSASGDIVVASPPYALAQDAASECKVFLGECYYDILRGIPYSQQILGFTPPLSLIRAYLIQAALRVPGIVKANVFFSAFSDRQLSGQVQVTDQTGLTGIAGF